MKIIARIHSDFPEKFGIPRQSGLAKHLTASIVFEEEYRVPEAFRGLEGFDYIWLIWQFSEAIRESWSPTVRPPRLGGNTRLGVFATRSPFRPNPIGLSAVRLEKIEKHPAYGTILRISGADLMDGTPIYDIKPYIPYADAYPDARSGFADGADKLLSVVFPETLLQRIPETKREGLIEALSQDPRPRYCEENDRGYGLYFAGFNIRFMVRNRLLTVSDVQRIS